MAEVINDSRGISYCDLYTVLGGGFLLSFM